jgi:3-deoxy-7-phosphoheptulonate synthase
MGMTSKMNGAAIEAGEWTPDSWKKRLAAQQVVYPDRAAVAAAFERLRTFPPLVTSWGIEHLRQQLAEAAEGKRFVLQGGDCAETLADCRPDIITNKLKIMLKMSLVLTHGLRRPIVRVGRIAGQYAKPRSSDTETKDGVTLPSYRGDLINQAEFNESARKPDPFNMVQGYMHAALTLNFIRSLTESGFADLRHPEYWDLAFLHQAHVAPEVREKYERTLRHLSEALRFMEAIGESAFHELARVEFFCSHEALNLLYESAQTREVPRRDGYYNLTTHLPWIGDRTRALDGAHIEYIRGIRNPVGVKVGPTMEPDELKRLVEFIDPAAEPGRVVLITRFGAAKLGDHLPGLIRAVRQTGRRPVWLCDPMHGNTTTTTSGHKTRDFDAILAELNHAIDAHDAAGSVLGGVHFEMTGEDVTECIGGASGVREQDLDLNYTTKCDPRLNFQQALEMAFLVAERLGNGG